MAANGGSVESIGIAGREFPMTADADINRQIGGYTNESQANGDGSARQIKTRMLPMLSGNVVSCDDSRGDHEFVQGVADGSEYVPCFITYVDGSVYQGRAQVEGEITHSAQNATLSFDLKGIGTFTRQ